MVVHPSSHGDSSCPAVLWIQPDYDPFQIRGSHTLWPAFPCRSFKNRFSLKLSVTPKILLPSVWPLPLSLATTRGISVDVFSSPYLDVSVQAVPDVWLWIHHTTTEVFSARFPHSDISGSMDICSSPKLFAAYHVFHRLLVPRHPPCALYSLTNWFSPAGAGYSSTIHSVVSLVLGSLFKTSYCLVTSFDVTPRMSWICFSLILSQKFMYSRYWFNMQFSRYMSDWHFYQSLENSNSWIL